MNNIEERRIEFSKILYGYGDIKITIKDKEYTFITNESKKKEDVFRIVANILMMDIYIEEAKDNNDIPLNDTISFYVATGTNMVKFWRYIKAYYTDHKTINEFKRQLL